MRRKGEKLSTSSSRIAERKSLCVQLMQAGFSRQMVLEELERRGFPPRESQATYDEVLKGWCEAFEQDRATFKIQQAERLRSHIAQAAAAQKWSQVASLERIYAEVVGTLAPLRVEVDDGRVMRDALASVIASLSEEELDRMAIEQAELEAAAAQARLLAPAPQKRNNGANGGS
jgi:hypothetical protein